MVSSLAQCRSIAGTHIARSSLASIEVRKFYDHAQHSRVKQRWTFLCLFGSHSAMHSLSCTHNTREYADQLKASRDELAAASKTEAVSATLSTVEKRAFLTQKAFIEKMATEARRYVATHI